MFQEIQVTCNTNVSYAFFLTQPHTGTAFEVEGGKPGSDRNEEGGDKLC
mgnify:CR=1 FL=1